MTSRKRNRRKRSHQRPGSENKVQHVARKRKPVRAGKKIAKTAEKKRALASFSQPRTVNSQRPPNKHQKFPPDSEIKKKSKPKKKRAKLAGQNSVLESCEFPDVQNMNSRKSKKRKFEPHDSESGHEVERHSNRKTFQRVTQKPQKALVQREPTVDSFQHILSVPFGRFGTDDKFWKKIPIRGPYLLVFSRLSDKTFRNSPLRNLIRRLLDKVYRNLLKYREKHVPLLTQRFDESRKPTVDDAIGIAEEMCQKVFRFVDDDGLLIDLYEDNTSSALKILFYSKDLNIPYSSEIFRRLKSLCAAKNVNATTEELEDVRNRLVFFCFHIARTLLLYILSINFKCPDQVVIRKKVDSFADTWTFYGKTATFNGFPSFLMSRNKSVSSLWVTIPCEDRDHLLELVMDYGLIQQLPEAAKTFLTNWIVDVQKKMRSRLRKGDLRRNVEKYMVEADRGELISLEDVRVEGIITAVLNNALNTKEFRVFDSSWEDITLNLIKTSDKHRFRTPKMNTSLLENASSELDPTSLDRLSSCFPNSSRREILISHCLQQILNFVVRFAMSTIRHIFRVEQFTLVYDLQLDEVTTGFQSYENTAGETKELKTPKSESSSSSSFDTKSSPNVRVIPRPVNPPTSTPPVLPPIACFPEYSDSDVLLRTMWPRQSRATFMPNIINNAYQVSSQSFNPSHTQQGFEESPSNFIRVPLGEVPAKRPKTESFNNSRIPEGTGEDLNRARTLRSSSVASTPRDIFEGIPEEWVVIGKAELEKKKQLTAEFQRSEDRLDTLFSKVD